MLVELAADARSRLEEIYGPLGRLGVDRFTRYSDEQLRMLIDFLTEGYQLRAEQAARIRGESEGAAAMIHIRMRVWVHPDGRKDQRYRVTVEQRTFSDDGLGDPPRIMRQAFGDIQAASAEAALNIIVGGLERTLRANHPDVTFDIGPMNEN